MDHVIDSIRKVSLNGFDQKIHIRSDNKELPVILFLHGGPGISNRHDIMASQDDLLDDFTIVAWDQRGTGGSYHKVDPKTLNVDQLVEDARALVEYLCNELDKDKVYLIGGSWGTELGTFLSYRYPEHIGGYIGYGQVVNGIQNEDICYAYTLEKATEAKDEKAVKILKKVGPPIRGQYKPCFKGLMAERKIMKKYGGHSMKKTTYFKSFVKPILLSKEYSLSDKWGMIQGYKLVLSSMWPSLVDYDFRKDCTTYKVPYYIFQGRHDKNTPSDLIQGYYDVIKAPDKDLIWFENSAHGPLGEEPAKFKKLIREKFLKK